MPDEESKNVEICTKGITLRGAYEDFRPAVKQSVAIADNALQVLQNVIGLPADFVNHHLGRFRQHDKERLNVQKMASSEMTSLGIQKDNEPIFTVTLNQSAQVREVATALAENRPFAEALKQCNARFEVSRFPSTSDLRDKELSVIHKILQQETKGTIYTPWDRRLSSSE